jgi:CRISPR/Cas system endoribonuclease Cas6 (RAMP superfamily)
MVTDCSDCSRYVLTYKNVFFWDVLLSGLVDRYHSFIGTYCCNVQVNVVCLRDESIKF